MGDHTNASQVLNLVLEHRIQAGDEKLVLYTVERSGAKQGTLNKSRQETEGGRTEKVLSHSVPRYEYIMSGRSNKRREKSSDERAIRTVTDWRRSSF